jgi:dTDP-glucose 4,6-dehydratase
MKEIAVITGAAGFLGSHLSDRLLAEGFRVIGIDNHITGSPDNIAHHANNSSPGRLITSSISPPASPID